MSACGISLPDHPRSNKIVLPVLLVAFRAQIASELGPVPDAVQQRMNKDLRTAGGEFTARRDRHGNCVQSDGVPNIDWLVSMASCGAGFFHRTPWQAAGRVFIGVRMCKDGDCRWNRPCSASICSDHYHARLSVDASSPATIRSRSHIARKVLCR